MTPDPVPSSRDRIKRIVRLAALALSLAFMVALLASQWQALAAYQWQFQPGWLLPSFLLLAGGMLLEMSIWRWLLGSLGGHLRWRRAAQTWFLSNIVRFIPGNIWQLLGMAELAADDGVSRLTTFTSIVLHQVLSIAAGATLAALYFALAGHSAWLELIRPLLWLVPLGLLLCHPRVLQWILNRGLALLRRPPIQVTLSGRQLIAALLGYGAAWLLTGSGFALLAAAITPITAPQFAALVATWTAAYVIGYLSLVTPGGLGVREGIMVLLLTPLFPAPIPTVIALAARLWTIVAEAVGAAVAFIARSRDRNTTPAGAPALAAEARDA
jgi:uncharacterized membrane protein YbhN (UPF0104 family)